MDHSHIVYPDTDQIDPEEAKFLFDNHCAILVVENLPTGSEIGIDLSYFRTGDKFKGIKLIPPGLHFVFASAVEKKNISQSGPRTGFYHDFKPRELLLKIWSDREEEFLDDNLVDQSQVERYRANLYDLDRYLGAYRYSGLRQYLALTSKMTTDIVKFLEPDCRKLRSVTYLTNSENADTADEDYDNSSKTTVHPNSDIPNLTAEKSTVIHFTDISSSKARNPKLKEADLTTYNLDSSAKLTDCFPNESSRARLLAELQFAFVTFILCHHYSCFEQWQEILKLVCQADRAIEQYPSLFEEFIMIIRYQMDHVPEDLFDDIVDSNNLVRSMLDTLFENIRTCKSAPPKLNKIALDLRSHLEQKFGWIFELERDDEQPVIVEL